VTVSSKLLERIFFEGHPSVTAFHPTTIEMTKEREITGRADCIIGVSADKAASDLEPAVKKALQRSEAKVRLTIQVGGERFSFTAHGNRQLTLDDPRELVIRKSDFVSSRTVAVRSEAAAADIPRSIVERLRREERGEMTFEVFVP